MNHTQPLSNEFQINNYYIDQSMLPYYCNKQGAYLTRSNLLNPTTVPHILVRAFTSTSTYGIIVGNVSTIVDCNGDYIEHIEHNKLHEYIDSTDVGFLDEIKATCAACIAVISKPGAVDRSGKDKYHHIYCANCAGMLPRQLNHSFSVNK